MTPFTSVEVRIQRARTSLLLDHPFFGSLLFRLKGREAASIETMATDGVSLFYNPAFVMELPAAQLIGVLAHEVLHPALQHHLRRGGRCPDRWNRACDYAINLLVLDAGLSLPSDLLIDEQYRGMSAEQIYNLLEKEEGTNGRPAQTPQSTAGPEKDGPSAPVTKGGIGQVLDAPLAEECFGKTLEQQAADWGVAVSHAQTISRLAGKLPAGVERSLESGAEARVDWRELLRGAWSNTIPSDYSWTRPNRRHIWQGLYLPGVQCEGVGEVAIFVDCSGSINGRQLALFEAEVRSILEGQRPERVHVVYFDTEVHKVDHYESGEPIQLSPLGGGGTDFRPCFNWVEEQGVRPQVLVFLTDLYGPLPDREPTVPVVWASTGERIAPFGEVVPLHAA
jgi:predicted metal-dependent peptidase